MDEFFHRLERKNGALPYLFVFGAALCLMLCVMIPFVVLDGGTFIYIGDYNSQQIPFYIEANEAIRSGELGWNHNTDLGANFIGSYAFYLLGSPFFWLTLLLPMEWVAPAMPFLLCLKTATAAATAYGFLKRFLKKRSSAFLGSLLYAFSGFAFYNIFFNHFHEIIAFFPLMLTGLEKRMQENKRGLFLFAVALNALANYYFFVAEVVFIVIYFFVRLLTSGYKGVPRKRIFPLALESVLGFLLAAGLVLPAVLATLQIGRATTMLEGWNILVYSENQRPLQLLQAFFLPPEICSLPNVFPNAGGKWSSVTAWLPLFGFAGTMTWLQRRPRDGWGILCVTLLICTFVPILNAAFQLFSNNFYTRWFFAFVLILALVTMKAFEECDWKEWRFGILSSGAIGLALCLPQALIVDPQTGVRGLSPNLPLLYVHIALTALDAAILFFGMRAIKKKGLDLTAPLSLFLGCYVILFGLFYIGSGKDLSRGSAQTFARRYVTERGQKETVLSDNERIDTTHADKNAGMYWNMPCVRCFHSIVPGSIFDFYETIGNSRSVNSAPEVSNLWLHSLLSAHYLFDLENENRNSYPGYTYAYEDGDFSVYTLDSFIPMGFSYEDFITRSQLEKNYLPTTRTRKMLNTLVVEDEDADELRAVLPESEELLFSKEQSDVTAVAARRREHVCSDFSYGKDSFSAKFTAEKRRVVFFSVPYDSGWSATVNGEEAKIYRVNAGFMAVICEEGENDIQFSYETPGLKTGLRVASGAAAVTALYLALPRRKKKQDPTVSSCEMETVGV